MNRYRFGDFDLDLAAFELRRHGEPVKLERRPLDFLVLLLQEPGRLVPREEIIAALWPTNVVIDFDAGINTLARKVRTALGDSSEKPMFIETVPGRGYRFVAPVVDVAEVGSTPTETPGAPPAGKRRLWLIAAALSLLLAIGAGLFFTSNDRAPLRPARIALMPFENLTGDPGLAYLASGLAEDTSHVLAQVDPINLHVIGVAVTPLANDAPLRIDELGTRLGVDFVVLGSVRADGTRIRVTSRLLRTENGEQLWSGSIDRELTNVLGVQRELSIAIAEQVRIRLSPQFAAAIERRQTQNPEAYALYLKGRYEWLQLTPASIRRAMAYFEQATAADPNYALGWAGLAFAASTSTRTADAEPAVMRPVALRALRRALDLAPDLAETQYAQGYYSLFLELDPRAAAVAARKAIQLDPNNSQAHMLLAVSLTRNNRVEASEMMRRARELDPMFALAYANSAQIATGAGEPARGLEFATQAIAINPEFWVGHLYLASARKAMGDAEGAVQAYADAARYSDGHSLTYLGRARLLIELGRRDEARSLLAEMTARSERQYVPSYPVAIIHALLGERDAAFASLERAIAARDLGLADLPTNRAFRPLHSDPRFADLLRRCGCVASD